MQVDEELAARWVWRRSNTASVCRKYPPAARNWEHLARSTLQLLFWCPFLETAPAGHGRTTLEAVFNGHQQSHVLSGRCVAHLGGCQSDLPPARGCAVTGHRRRLARNAAGSRPTSVLRKAACQEMRVRYISDSAGCQELQFQQVQLPHGGQSHLLALASGLALPERRVSKEKDSGKADSVSMLSSRFSSRSWRQWLMSGGRYSMQLVANRHLWACRLVFWCMQVVAMAWQAITLQTLLSHLAVLATTASAVEYTHRAYCAYCSCLRCEAPACGNASRQRLAAQVVIAQIELRAAV